MKKVKLPASVDYMRPYMVRCPECDRYHHNTDARKRCYPCASTPGIGQAKH